MKQITKDQFVAVLDTAGITSEQRRKLHAAFERAHPEAHKHFLAYLGVPPPEIAEIRRQSRQS